MSARSLAKRFEERIREVQQHLPNLSPGFGTDDIPPGETRTYVVESLSESSSAPGAERLAIEVAANVERYASTLIPDSTIRRNVLADDELVSLWPLETCRDSKTTDEGYLLAFTAIIQRSTKNGSWWHPDVTFNEAAAMLDRVQGDNDARFAAELLRRGKYDPNSVSVFNDDNTDLDRFWTPTAIRENADGTEERVVRQFPRHLEGLEPAFFGLPDESDDTKRKQLVAYGYEKTIARWYPFAVSVLAYLERKVRDAYKAHARIPTAIAEAITSVRGGALAPGTEPRIYTGQTFPIPAAGFRHWRIKPPSNTQTEFLIALDGSIEQPSPHDIRSFLTGSRIRTWWATWVLAFERAESTGEPFDGFFNWNPRHIINDLLQMKPESCGKNSPYTRPNRKVERQIASDFLFLESCILRGVGDGPDAIEVQNGEALIHRYGQVRRNGRTMSDVDLCAHARLATMSVQHSFVQVPLKAFQLDAAYAPLAMGIANVLRRNVLGRRAWLDRGALTMPLGDFLREVGEDIPALKRRWGRGVWAYERERIAKAVEPAGFGSLHFGSGADDKAETTIEPTEQLAIVYRTMRGAQKRRQEFDAEAAIRAELEPKRGRGRPRKMPGGKR